MDYDILTLPHVFYELLFRNLFGFPRNAHIYILVRNDLLLFIKKFQTFEAKKFPVSPVFFH